MIWEENTEQGRVRKDPFRLGFRVAGDSSRIHTGAGKTFPPLSKAEKPRAYRSRQSASEVAGKMVWVTPLGGSFSFWLVAPRYEAARHSSPRFFCGC